MSTEKTTKFYATRDFRDAGTGAYYYNNGKPYEAPDGVVGNYTAAGLASDKKPMTADAETPA